MDRRRLLGKNTVKIAAVISTEGRNLAAKSSRYLRRCVGKSGDCMENSVVSCFNQNMCSNLMKTRCADFILIYFEINFHEGPPHNLKNNALLGSRLYNGVVPLVGYGQLVAFKKEAFDLTRAHIKKYEDDNPSYVSSYINTVWSTDQESRERVTAYMKCLAVEGVPGTF